MAHVQQETELLMRSSMKSSSVRRKVELVSTFRRTLDDLIDVTILIPMAHVSPLCCWTIITNNRLVETRLKQAEIVPNIEHICINKI